MEENYEIAEAVCIPRSTLYCHYLDYCETNDTQPVNAASFGKVGRGGGYSNSFKAFRTRLNSFLLGSISRRDDLFSEKLRSYCYYGSTSSIWWSYIAKSLGLYGFISLLFGFYFLALNKPLLRIQPCTGIWPKTC